MLYSTNCCGVKEADGLRDTPEGSLRAICDDRYGVGIDSAYITITDTIIDAYLIAKMEFLQKKIPFIIRRPLPNGGSEYWKFADLEQLD